ncbi:MAG: cadherin-like beta sandwich domain-containing protein [Clostridiales bacterium]|nr:cadherin-like beta sandwich domain-containing protein [Clostridiales bacterium]
MNTNQRNVFRRILYCLVFSLIIVCFEKSDIALASSATVGFEIEEGEYMVGDQITVTLTVKTDANLGDFDGSIIYNSTVLEYVQGPSCIAGGDGMLRIEDMDASSSWNLRSYVMTFKAIDFGDCEFAFVDAPLAYEYESGNAMSVSATTKTISVLSLPEASDNAELAVLKLGKSELTPSFDSKVMEYSTIVDSTTTQLVLSAIPVDSKAKVSVEGNKNFEVGNNKVVITVTSEAGTSQQYIIQVVKEDRETVSLPVAKEESQKSDSDGSFRTSVEGGITLIHGGFEYTVVKETDGITIPDGYVKTSIKVNGNTIPVYQLAANAQDDYLLLVLQNQFGQTNLYRYDRFEKTIQRYTGDRVIIQGNPDEAELTISQLKRTYQNKLGKKNLVIVVLGGLLVVVVICLITLYLKTKEIRNDEFY